MNTREYRRKVLAAVSDPNRRESIANELDQAGFSCLQAHDGLEAWGQFSRTRPVGILASSGIKGLDGIELLSRVRRVSTIPFLLEVGEADFDSAVAAIQLGANAVVQRSDSPRSLSERLCAFLERESGKSIEDHIASAFPGKTAPIVRLRKKLAALADLDVNVLFTGEPGSGRTYAARTLCSAGGSNPESILLLRPDGQDEPTPEALEGRVVLLQNVHSFPLPLQARWSDSLESLDSPTKESPCRVLATSDRSLDRMVDTHEFLPELAERLSRFSIEVPPLREYGRDMRVLIDRLCKSAAEHLGKRNVMLTHRAAGVLQSQAWLGNIHQLRDVVEQLVAFSRNGSIAKADVEVLLGELAGTVGSMRLETESRRRAELVQQLEAAEGNLAEVARRIGMSRGAVIYRAQKYGLLPSRKTRRGSETSVDRSA